MTFIEFIRNITCSEMMAHEDANGYMSKQTVSAAGIVLGAPPTVKFLLKKKNFWRKVGVRSFLFCFVFVYPYVYYFMPHQSVAEEIIVLIQ